MSRSFTVTVYCGASELCDDTYKNAATKVGQFIGENGWHLYFGAGSKGLMGRVAHACLKYGGKVHGIGFKNDFLSELEPPAKNLTTLQIKNSIHERKKILHTSGDLILTLPGGIGTLDEFMEALTWQYLGLNTNPIIIFNINGFWNLIEQLLDHLIQEKFVKDASRICYEIVTSMEDLEKKLLSYAQQKPSCLEN
jgi:uncharacterized protein (TIGR00730 family)